MPENWLLLRGLVRERRHWAGFDVQLAARTGGRVLTLDLPGVGTERHRPSPASLPGIVADLRGRFERGGERWSLFAPSLGGMLALTWAQAHPGDFDRVVVCNTSARDVASLFERFSWFALRTALRGLVQTDLVRREAGILALVANTDTARAHTARFATFAEEAPPPRATLLRQLWAASRARTPASLPVPLLVMASDGDRLCAPAASRRLAAKLGAPLVIHPDAGHDLPLDAPDWVIDQLVAGA